MLAIENRMGLKYLNGAREDHSGRAFEGIQGYPWGAGSPVTWSLRELRAACSAEAGLRRTSTRWCRTRTTSSPTAIVNPDALQRRRTQSTTG